MPELIKILMALGQMRTATQSLSDEEIELIATEVKREVTIKHAAEEELEPEEYEDDEADLVPRPPVVTIMGHVDHGKTTLLDAIREASVVETEAGGITQHIGAYQAEVDGRRITFLDTPGHEAFTAMRARGAKVTDIAVLVVAADDGVMPQTKESISHARAAEVPIVVAVNKMDVPGRELGPSAQRARRRGPPARGVGRDDAVLGGLGQAEDEPRRPPREDPARRGRGARPARERRCRGLGRRHRVAARHRARARSRRCSCIAARCAWATRPSPATPPARCARSTTTAGRRSRRPKPGDPVEILGFDHPPTAGEFVRVVEHERQAKHLANVRAERLRREQLAQRPRRRVSLESFHGDLLAGEVQDLNIVLKGDVQGSVEALLSELQKIQHSEVRVNVIHTGVGGITENDVNLASASDALVIGFNVRPSADARALAEREGVDIRTYRVIYQLTDDIQNALVGMLSPVQTEETLGEAEVRALFKVSRLGTIAGCMVTTGVVRRGAQVRIVRDGTVIYETSIAQLKRFKDDAREVAEGFECGILLDGFNDVKEGDILEVYETRQVERTDLGEPAPVRRSRSRRRVSASASRGRLRGDPVRRAALPRERVAEGKAEVREVREGAAARAVRRHRRGGRVPRALAARRADGRVRREGTSRAAGAARRGRALSGLAGVRAAARRPGGRGSR